MKDPTPTFPPFLTGHRLDADKSPAAYAKARAAKGKLGAGDLVWSESRENLNFALVLEPDVPRARCGEMLFVAMVALGDALGALVPPEVGVTYAWPSIVLLNGAEIGYADLVLSGKETENMPDWMVLAIDIAMHPGRHVIDPGNDLTKTTMWDEGCGNITRSEWLESASRHIVNWIHTWSEEGFKPVHNQWWARLTDQAQIAEGVLSIHQGGLQLTGLDESGNALVKVPEGTDSIDTFEALSRLRKKRGAAA